MNTIVKILIAVAVSTIGIAILNIFGLIPVWLISQDKMSSLPAIAISSGVLIASITYLRDKASQTATHQRNSDEIYLNLARESFNEVHDLLKDLNNDRVIWVRASRLLLNTLKIRDKIKTPDITEAFELAQERLRNELYRCLTVRSDTYSSRQALPPQFFYGIPDWKTEASLNNAAIKSSGTIEVHRITMDQNLPEPELSPLSEKTVIAIYDFMQFPPDYDDPLVNVQLWDNNWESSNGVNQGARRYISHKRKYSAIGGKLHKRKANNTSSLTGAKNAPPG